jgi:hypothetical protein
MTQHSGAPDAQLIAQITRVATSAATAVQAIGEGDQPVARQKVDRLRVVWSTLRHGDTRELQARYGGARSVEGAEALFHGLQVLATCEEVIKLWARQGFEQALASGDALDVAGWHAALDHLLPLRWNFECDVLAVHGRLPAELAAAIEARGQRRTLLIGPDSGSPLPPGGVRVESEQAVTDYISGFRRLVPKQHFSIDTADGLLSAEDVQRMDAYVGSVIQNQRMSWRTWRRFAADWLGQGLNNLPAIIGGGDVNEVGRRFAGRPAIVISPGPSLEKNIDVLRQAQGRALLLAPLQTLRRLHREGIRPDFLVVLDSQDQTVAPIDFFAGVPDAWLPDLIAAATTHPNVLRRFSRVHFFAAASPLDRLLHTGKEFSWPELNAGSVSISCMRLAHHWRCSSITLVGQDLAFAEGKRYADATGCDVGPTKAARTLPGYHGGTVQTAPDYFMFHHQFEVLAAKLRAQRPELRLFNCTEGGAAIGGFEQLPLQDMLAQHVLPLAPVAAQVHKPDAGRVDARRRVIAEHLRRAAGHVAAGLQAVDTCARHAAQAHRGPEFLNRLAREDTGLRDTVERLQFLMEERMQDFDDALTTWEASEELEDYLNGSLRYREIAREAFTGVGTMLAEALLRVQGSGRGTVRTTAKRAATV